MAELYDFSAEKSGDVAQKDLNYADACARRLLSEAAAEGNRERSDLWAALMCDAAARDGRIEATPLCLLFGQGHQHFLERLATVPRTEAPPPRGRGKNRVSVTASETIEEALFFPWTRQDPTPGFRWDPEEDVRYALRASDPSGEKSTTQHGANRLAALGLPVLTAVPVQRGNRVRLQVLGGSLDREFTFAWPIWREPASLAAIRAMLSHPDLTNNPATAQNKLAHLGVEQVRRARRIGGRQVHEFHSRRAYMLRRNHRRRLGAVGLVPRIARRLRAAASPGRAIDGIWTRWWSAKVIRSPPLQEVGDPRVRVRLHVARM